MPFIPHTDDDVRAMLAVIGVDSIEALFGEIPPQLRCAPLERLPEGLSEIAVTRLMAQRAEQNRPHLCFAGAGAYLHHIPAAVWELAFRGEFYSAYTPYQAEASQGTLQVLYEYQSMMAGLMAMEVSNASLYDGASALAEAILMAVRANRRSKSKRILIPKTVHPTYRQVARTIVRNQHIELVELDFDAAHGRLSPDTLNAWAHDDITALVIPQPNFFGLLEDADALCDWAESHGALGVAVVNPTAMALLKPPGNWGARGADIVCGEGQPLGVPLSSGGPYFGFLCCRQQHVHQMPGRLVGRTIDADGKHGFTLTLQPREQHIRRGKATSNICTNQGLMVTAATIYLALLGPEGLARTAAACHANTKKLVDRLGALDGVEPVFDAAFFHEWAIRLPKPTSEVLHALAAVGILGGVDLSAAYPELGSGLLICATEVHSDAELDHYARSLEEVLAC